VSVGGQAAKDGTPFAQIENPMSADAELSVQSKDGMIIVTVNASQFQAQRPRYFAARQNQNESR
jgi:hypothetical protein